MADIDEILNQEFKDQNYSIPLGSFMIVALKKHIQTSIYLETVLKKQIRIQRLLQNRSIDEDEIEHELSDLTSELNDDANRALMDLLAKIAK